MKPVYAEMACPSFSTDYLVKLAQHKFNIEAIKATLQIIRDSDTNTETEQRRIAATFLGKLEPDEITEAVAAVIGK